MEVEKGAATSSGMKCLIIGRGLAGLILEVDHLNPQVPQSIL